MESPDSIFSSSRALVVGLITAESLDAANGSSLVRVAKQHVLDGADAVAVDAEVLDRADGDAVDGNSDLGVPLVVRHGSVEAAGGARITPFGEPNTILASEPPAAGAVVVHRLVSEQPVAEASALFSSGATAILTTAVGPIRRVRDVLHHMTSPETRS